jgi:hypothetical protein
MKNCIVILGTHRSGTSALMGALKLCGVNIGPRWLADLYEHPAIVTLHDEMLGDLKSSWDDAFLLENSWWTSEKIKHYKEKIIEIITNEFKHAQWWGIKDPRMCILLPLWLEIFEELSISPHFIISIRNPLEIAGSHERRDDFSLEKSLLIWMKHLLSAEYYSREYPRVFTRYDNLVANPQAAISSMTHILNIELPKSFNEVSEDLQNFIKPSLKHHSMEDAIHVSHLPDIIKELNHILLKCSQNTELNDTVINRFDQIRAEFTKMQKFLLNSDLKSKFSDLKAKKKQSFDAALEISEFGRDFMSTGKFKESKKLYENLIQIIPENFIFWNNLGVALENMDEIETAMDCFKRALDINRSYSYALENLQRLKVQSSNKSLQTSSR